MKKSLLIFILAFSFFRFSVFAEDWENSLSRLSSEISIRSYYIIGKVEEKTGLNLVRVYLFTYSMSEDERSIRISASSYEKVSFDIEFVIKNVNVFLSPIPTSSKFNVDVSTDITGPLPTVPTIIFTLPDVFIPPLLSVALAVNV